MIHLHCVLPCHPGPHECAVLCLSLQVSLPLLIVSGWHFLAVLEIFFIVAKLVFSGGGGGGS